MYIYFQKITHSNFGLIKNEIHSDLTEAKFFLQVNIHIGMKWKICLYFGEEKQLLNLILKLFPSCHGAVGLE